MDQSGLILVFILFSELLKSALDLYVYRHGHRGQSEFTICHKCHIFFLDIVKKIVIYKPKFPNKVVLPQSYIVKRTQTEIQTM